MLEIRFTRLSDVAQVPRYARPGDAACDLVACVDVDIAPLGRASVGTGLALEIPSGYAGLVLPRSGLATKHGVTLANSPGLIDSGYRGEIIVALFNSDALASYSVKSGDRIAQLLLLAIPMVSFSEAASLSRSERGAGGFGSTGVGSLTT